MEFKWQQAFVVDWAKKGCSVAMGMGMGMTDCGYPLALLA